MTPMEMNRLLSDIRHTDWIQYSTAENARQCVDYYLSNQTSMRRELLRQLYGSWDGGSVEYVGVDLSASKKPVSKNPKKSQESDFDSDNKQLDDFLQSFSRKETYDE